jgi:phosphatidylglycerol:prolipoprotein diacylglycerol transferase
MHPILFEIFGASIPAWHTMFAIAMICAYVLSMFLARQYCSSPNRDSVPFLFLLAYVSGWFGARALGILTEETERFADGSWIGALFSFGPMTFYGGALAGTLAVLIALWTLKRPVLELFDIAMPSVLVGLAVGRVGCFLNGCDYGYPAPTQTWWAHVNPILNDDIARYPTQLEESAASFILALVSSVWILRTKNAPHRQMGRIGAWTLLATSMHRFFQERFRGDFRGQFFGSELSTSQGISLILATIALALLFTFWLGRKSNP